MIKGCYRIADVVIEIRSIYGYVHQMCRDYRVDVQIPDIIIETTKEDIIYERAILENLGDNGYRDDFIETFVVHRKLATQLLKFNILLFHGSAVAVDGEVYIFTAKSGTGKSTHTRLWRQKFGDRAVMVNDDKPMLRVHDTKVDVCGTPWNGKHHLDTNIELPLKSICIIRRSLENHIDRISVNDALPVLWEQSYRPSDASDLGKMLELLGEIVEHVPIYVLGCNMNPEAADVAWNGMNGSNINIM
jgi:hypothetical protein